MARYALTGDMSSLLVRTLCTVTRKRSLFTDTIVTMRIPCMYRLHSLAQHQVISLLKPLYGSNDTLLLTC